MGVRKMKLTIALQDEMKAKLISGNLIEIDIPDDCKRDLWKAQIECWLENDEEKLIHSGFLRVESNTRLKFTSK
jgi:hypothetical protein